LTFFGLRLRNNDLVPSGAWSKLGGMGDGWGQRNGSKLLRIVAIWYNRVVLGSNGTYLINYTNEGAIP